MSAGRHAALRTILNLNKTYTIWIRTYIIIYIVLKLPWSRRGGRWRRPREDSVSTYDGVYVSKINIQSEFTMTFLFHFVWNDRTYTTYFWWIERCVVVVIATDFFCRKLGGFMFLYEILLFFIVYPYIRAGLWKSTIFSSLFFIENKNMFLLCDFW